MPKNTGITVVPAGETGTLAPKEDTRLWSLGFPIADRPTVVRLVAQYHTGSASNIARWITQGVPGLTKLEECLRVREALVVYHVLGHAQSVSPVSIWRCLSALDFHSATVVEIPEGRVWHDGRALTRRNHQIAELQEMLTGEYGEARDTFYDAILEAFEVLVGIAEHYSRIDPLKVLLDRLDEVGLSVHDALALAYREDDRYLMGILKGSCQADDLGLHMMEAQGDLEEDNRWEEVADDGYYDA